MENTGFQEAGSLQPGDKIVCIDGISEDFEFENLHLEEVVSIEDIGVQRVYNLTANNTHTYIANGIVTHNTGGNVDLVKPAQEIMLNPDTHKLLTMDWDILDKHAKENATWSSGMKCGIFVPAQYALKFRKIDTNLADYTGSDDEYLKQIKIKVTDFKSANEILDADEEQAKLKDSKTLLDLQTHYPRDVPDCFMSNKSSPFPVRDATEHLVKLKNKGITYHGVDISLGANNRIEQVPSSKDLAPYPFGGGNIDCPIQIFIDPPKNPKFNSLFVGGLDYVKQKESSTTSVGAVYIIQRMGKIGDVNSYKIAASYASRPENPEDFDDNTYMLQLGYGAIILQEAADTGYETYLRRKKIGMTKFLASGKKVSQTKAKLKQAHVEFGLYPTPENKEHVLRAVVKYCHEMVEVVENINGEDVSTMKKGIYRIDDIQLLEEIIGYYPGRNCDRIIAFGHALVWAQYLDSIYDVPDMSDNDREPTKQPPRKASNFRNRISLDTHSIRMRRNIYPTKKTK